MIRRAVEFGSLLVATLCLVPTLLVVLAIMGGGGWPTRLGFKAAAGGLILFLVFSTASRVVAQSEEVTDG